MLTIKLYNALLSNILLYPISSFEHSLFHQYRMVSSVAFDNYVNIEFCVDNVPFYEF